MQAGNLPRGDSQVRFFRYFLAVLALCAPRAGYSQSSSPINENPVYSCYFSTPIAIGRTDGGAISGQARWNSRRIVQQKKKLKKQIAAISPARAGSSKAQKLQKLRAQRAKMVLLARLIKSCLDGGADEKVDFSAVQPIIEINCMGCHTAQGSWQNAEEWFISSGKVIPGNLASSPLYGYLKENREGFAPATMPKGMSALSSDNINTIRNWIIGLSSDVPAPPFKFACEAGSDPSPSPLKRLSQRQYINTLHDLLRVLPSAEQLLLRDAISPVFEQLPPDRAQSSFLEEQVFENNDIQVLQEHIDAYFRVATAFASEVSSTSTRIRLFSEGNCEPASSGSGLTCLRSFLGKFLLKAFRRPPSSAELETYEAFFISRPAATAFGDIIARALMSPDFLYHIEVGESFVEGRTDLLRLSPYELVNRLYYHFWQSMPDAEGFAAAESGAVETFEGYGALVDRVFADTSESRTKGTIEDFYDEGLGIEKVQAINANDTAAFRAFAEGSAISVGGFEMLQDMITEMHDYLAHYTWNIAGRFEDLIQSDLAFASTDRLAALYGVPRWLGGDAPRFPAGQARGLIGRAILLVSGSHETNPAKRGARIAREIMCEPLPDPDPEIMDMVQTPPFNPDLSTRARFTSITSDASCRGCHSVINPYGFALEQYDAIGRFRSKELVYSERGRVVGEHAIDSTATLPGLGAVESAADVSQKIAEHGRAHGCFAQKYFRFTFRKRENQAVDGCALEALREQLVRDGGSIAGMLKEAALLTEFSMRKLP